MSDHERGAYTPPTDAPLSFDARQPVRGARPAPFTLIISILVLIGLGAAIAYFYHSGVRHAGQPPQTVGVPVEGMKTPPPPEAQPQDPAAGLQIYKAEGGKAAAPGAPQFTAPPEQPQARPTAPATKIVVTPAAPALPPAAAPALRPAISAKPLATARPAAAPKATPPAAPEPKAAPAPAAKVGGAAAVQIGAFSSQALADKGWNAAVALEPGAAAGKGKDVEKVAKDGKTLFRTQVTGFASRADAAKFCDRLKAAGKACFVK
jgi:cytoskeletal protein RodZ